MLAQAVTPHSRHVITVTGKELKPFKLRNMKYVLLSTQLVFSGVQKAVSISQQTRGNFSTASYDSLPQQERVNLLVLLGWKE